MDRERASFLRTLDSLQSAFGRGVIPLAIPLGEEKGFVGVADLLTEKADVYSDDQSGKFQAVDVPAEVREAAITWRERLVEMVAESNEDLMEEFFDKGTLPHDDLVRGLRQAVLAGRIFPVLPASSGRNVAVQPILDAIVDLLPSPVDRGEAVGTDPVKKEPTSRPPSASAPLSAFFFKTLAHPHAGRISLFRAYSGIMEEDPVLRLSRDAQPHEMLLSGTGQLHIEVAVGKLRKRFKVEVNLKKPKIPYRETIKAAAEGHGRHKKQTGGHGQFGDCKIRMKPLARGEDFKFVDDIFGGSIPKNFIPAVEKGIQEARLKGFVAGFPMVDFQVELFDGQYHDVDSSEMSFKIAGSLAFKDAVAKCRPTLLEPIMRVEIAVPEEHAGSVMGDLSSRRGRPHGMAPRGGLQVIKAEVPLSEMLSYDAELTSMTGGRGSYHMEMSRYEEVPGHLQEKIVAASRAERGEQVAEA